MPRTLRSVLNRPAKCLDDPWVGDPVGQVNSPHSPESIPNR